MRRRNRINQIVADFTRKPLSECRVLDLASLEGHFSAEMAIRGAREVIGIEGRQTSIDRANELFKYPNLKFVCDDVRNLSREKYGEFDIVLCLGILYHLDAPDCFKFLESIAEVCTGFAVIDTHAAQFSTETVEYKGKTYHGARFVEYEQEPSAEEQESKTWASIGNTTSFWATRPSLVNSIADAGFTSVCESWFPAFNDLPADRVTFICVKGEKQKVLAEQFDENILNERVDEVPRVPPVLVQPEKTSTLKQALGKTARKLGLRK